MSDKPCWISNGRTLTVNEMSDESYKRVVSPERYRLASSDRKSRSALSGECANTAYDAPNSEALLALPLHVGSAYPYLDKSVCRGT